MSTPENKSTPEEVKIDGNGNVNSVINGLESCLDELKKGNWTPETMSNYLGFEDKAKNLNIDITQFAQEYYILKKEHDKKKGPDSAFVPSNNLSNSKSTMPKTKSSWGKKALVGLLIAGLGIGTTGAIYSLKKGYDECAALKTETVRCYVKHAPVIGSITKGAKSCYDYVFSEDTDKNITEGTKGIGAPTSSTVPSTLAESVVPNPVSGSTQVQDHNQYYNPNTKVQNNPNPNYVDDEDGSTVQTVQSSIEPTTTAPSKVKEEKTTSVKPKSHKKKSHNIIFRNGYAVRHPGMFGFTQEDASSAGMMGDSFTEEKLGLEVKVTQYDEGTDVEFLAGDPILNHYAKEDDAVLKGVLFANDGSRLEVMLNENGYGVLKNIDNADISKYIYVAITDEQGTYKQNNPKKGDIGLASAKYSIDLKSKKIDERNSLLEKPITEKNIPIEKTKQSNEGKPRPGNQPASEVPENKPVENQPKAVSGSTVSSPAIYEGSTVEQLSPIAENQYTLSIRPENDTKFLLLDKSVKHPDDLRRANLFSDNYNGDYIIYVDPVSNQLEDLIPTELKCTIYNVDGSFRNENLKVNDKNEAKLEERVIGENAAVIKILNPFQSGEHEDLLILKAQNRVPAFYIYKDNPLVGELNDLDVQIPVIETSFNNKNGMPETIYDVKLAKDNDYLLVQSPERYLHDTYKITMTTSSKDGTKTEVELTDNKNHIPFRVKKGDNIEFKVLEHSEPETDIIRIQIVDEDENQTNQPQGPNNDLLDNAPNTQSGNTAKSNTNQPKDTTKQNNKDKNASGSSQANLGSRLNIAFDTGYADLYSKYETPTWKQETTGSRPFVTIEGSYDVTDTTRVGALINYGEADLDIKKNIGEIRTSQATVGLYTIGSAKFDPLNLDYYAGYNRSFGNSDIEVYNTKIEQTYTTDRILLNCLLSNGVLGADFGGILNLNRIEQNDPRLDMYGQNWETWFGSTLEDNNKIFEIFFKHFNIYNYELKRDLRGDVAGASFMYTTPQLGVSVYGEFPASNDDLKITNFSGNISIPLADNFYFNIGGGYTQNKYMENIAEVDNEKSYATIGISNVNANELRPFSHINNQ